MIPLLAHHSLLGRAALIVGCAPSLDLISDEDLKRIWDSGWLKIGLNFAPLSEKITRNKLRFDVVVFRDDCGTDLSKAHAALSDMAKRNEFLFIRIGSQADQGKYHQRFDAQYFPQSCGVAGNVVGLCYFAGIKKLSFLGVDLYGGYCQWNPEHDDLVNFQKVYNSENIKSQVVADYLLRWKMMLGKIDSHDFSCLSKNSLLLNAGIPLKTVDEVLSVKG